MQKANTLVLVAGWVFLLAGLFVPLSDKAGGALVLAALCCFGISLGFRFRKR